MVPFANVKVGAISGVVTIQSQYYCVCFVVSLLQYHYNMLYSFIAWILILVGYMFKNAEYRMSLTRSLKGIFSFPKMCSILFKGCNCYLSSLVTKGTYSITAPEVKPFSCVWWFIDLMSILQAFRGCRPPRR